MKASVDPLVLDTLSATLEKCHEKCGILAMYNPMGIDVFHFLDRLQRQQHRGNDAFGVSYYDEAKKKVVTVRIPGMIYQLEKFKEYGGIRDYLKTLPQSRMWIGHVRWGTSGKTGPEAIKQAHPVVFDGKDQYFDFHVNVLDEKDQPQLDGAGKPITERRTWCVSENGVSLAFNGNIPDPIQEKVKREVSYAPEIGTDTELLLHAYLQKGADWILRNIKVAYSIVILDVRDPDDPLLLMLRDSLMVKPACYTDFPGGAVGHDDEFAGASETKAIDDKRGISFLKSGEKLVVHGADGWIEKSQVNPILKEKDLARCLFEYVYYMDDTSKGELGSVSQYRYTVGRQVVKLLKGRGILERADHFIGVPHSGLIYANAAFAKVMDDYPEYNITTLSINKEGEIRTFVQKDKAAQLASSRKKYQLSSSTKPRVNNKHLILIDDSGVRATASETLVRMFSDIVINEYTHYKAREITLVFCSPKIVKGCDKGVAMYAHQLIALDKSGRIRSNSEIAYEIQSRAFNGKIPSDAPAVNVVYTPLPVLVSSLLKVYNKYRKLHGEKAVRDVGLCTECMEGGSCAYKPPVEL